MDATGPDIVCQSFASLHRTEGLCVVPEILEIVPYIKSLDVVDDIEDCNSCTGIVDSLLADQLCVEGIMGHINKPDCRTTGLWEHLHP